MPPGSSQPFPNPLGNPDFTDPSRNSTTPDAGHDPGPAPRDRDAFLSALFRETDRAQRMKTALSLIVFAVHEASDSSASLPPDAYREVLCQIIQRTVCTLRSYDMTGEVGDARLAVALPGCDTFSAVTLAERLRGGSSILPSGCMRQKSCSPPALGSLPAMAVPHSSFYATLKKHSTGRNSMVQDPSSVPAAPPKPAPTRSVS
jgi:GGDEF domain-containing protein